MFLLTVFLLILGGIPVLVLLLLCASVRVRFAWESGGEVRASVHYLFLRYRLSPDLLEKILVKDTEKELEKEEKKKAKQEKKAGKKLDKTLGAMDTVAVVWELLKSSGWSLRLLRRHLIFYGVRAYGAIGGPDAHQTGLRYGRISAAVYVGLGLLDQVFVLRRPDIYIAPNFVKDHSLWDLALRIRIRPIFVVVAGIHLFASFLRSLRHNKRKRQTGKKTVSMKGGKRHEPTAASHQ